MICTIADIYTENSSKMKEFSKKISNSESSTSKQLLLLYSFILTEISEIVFDRSDSQNNNNE